MQEAIAGIAGEGHRKPKAGSLCCCGLSAECRQSPEGIQAEGVMRKHKEMQ